MKNAPPLFIAGPGILWKNASDVLSDVSHKITKAVEKKYFMTGNWIESYLGTSFSPVNLEEFRSSIHVAWGAWLYKEGLRLQNEDISTLNNVAETEYTKFLNAPSENNTHIFKALSEMFSVRLVTFGNKNDIEQMVESCGCKSFIDSVTVEDAGGSLTESIIQEHKERDILRGLCVSYLPSRELNMLKDIRFNTHFCLTRTTRSSVMDTRPGGSVIMDRLDSLFPLLVEKIKLVPA